MKFAKYVIYLAFVLFSFNCSNQSSKESVDDGIDRIPIIPMEWNEKDHIKDHEEIKQAFKDYFIEGELKKVVMGIGR